jgi:hypothetical protein
LRDLGCAPKCVGTRKSPTYSARGLGTTLKYLRRSPSGAAGNGMCPKTKYLRGAAGIGMGTTTKYL